MNLRHTLKTLWFGVALAACLTVPALGEVTAGDSPQARTAAYLRSIRSQPPLLWAFLKDMPKGGDLHSHLSGAIYAESMIGWAAEDGLCVDQKTLVLMKPPCDEALGQVAAKSAQTDALLFRRMIDAWSMRNPTSSGLSGHDLFSDSFGKFDSATSGRKGDMLAEVASRARAGHVSYLELMATPAASETFKVAAKALWNDDFSKMRTALLENGLPEAVKAAANDLSNATARQQELLRCGTAQAAASGIGRCVCYV